MRRREAIPLPSVLHESLDVEVKMAKAVMPASVVMLTQTASGTAIENAPDRVKVSHTRTEHPVGTAITNRYSWRSSGRRYRSSP